MSGSLLQFKEKIKAVTPQYLVYPTKTLKESTQNTIAASSLTAKLVHNGYVPQDATHHFSLITPDEKKSQEVKTYFQNYFDYARINCIIDGKIYSEALAAGSIITSRLNSILGRKMTNEAEVRYCVVGPILDAMCKIWSYSAKLEESVKDEKNKDLQDYGIYSVRTLFENQIVALIIEFKRDVLDNSDIHGFNALAQLVGYYAAMSAKYPVCPAVPQVAFVITGEDVTPIIFPFYHYQGEDMNLLINAVSLPKFPIFSTNGLIDIDQLKFLLCLSSPPQDNPGISLITLTGEEETITRQAAEGLIITNDQSLQKELEAVKERTKEIKERTKEIEEQLLKLAQK